MLVSHLLLSSLLLFSPAANNDTSRRVEVGTVTDEADAVLAILAKQAASVPIPDADWQALFATEGYRRLKRREQSMQRTFEDADFKKFVLSADLLRRAPALRRTLEKWKGADISRPAQMALDYLPAEAHIHATIYPVIKPASNSFVFDVATDPAIFLYVDPEVSREEFENTVAHELHHIGYGTACPPPATEAKIAQQPAPVQEVSKWIGAFGEGFAMLAAAGGPDVHPHAVSKREDRERWDHDMANVAKDRQELDLFFRKILSGQLTQEEADKQAYTYFGVQGPWYTVGWKMGVTIEKAYGRQRLIEAMCNGPALLSAYNAAAATALPPGDEKASPWSPEIIKALEPIVK